MAVLKCLQSCIFCKKKAENALNITKNIVILQARIFVQRLFGVLEKKFFFVMMLLFLSFSIKAQYDPQFSQNMNCLSTLNSSMISMDGNVKIFGLYRQQWVGLTNAPTTTMFNASMPLKINGKNHAVGIFLMNDKFGLFSNQTISFQYAYQKKLFDGTLGLGGNMGFISTGFDGTKIQTLGGSDDYHQSNDPEIPTTTQNANSFDLGLGASYYDTKRYLGLSVMHLTRPTVSFEKTSFVVKPLINFVAGYNFFLPNTLYELKPSVMYKTDLSSFQLDLNTLLEYKKKIYGGFSYRIQDAIVIMFGIKINGMNVAYSYDITTSKLAKVSGGSHEVSIGYSLKLDFTERNKNKSIRIL